ncbi:MAG: hypothetical protein AAB932_02505 [Patescibacteria group bacterium]
MDQIEKLLRKISENDRQRLLDLAERIEHGQIAGLRIVKIHGSDLYRVRSGRFRIIFHREKQSKTVVIDSIKLRNERTYE